MKHALVVPGANEDSNLCALNKFTAHEMPIVLLKDKLLVFPPGTELQANADSILNAKRR